MCSLDICFGECASRDGVEIGWFDLIYVRPHFEKLSSLGFKGKILYIEWSMKWICSYFHVEQM